MPLMLGEKSLGYMVVAASVGKKVEDADVRLLEHLTPMIASMLRSVQLDTDARAKSLSLSQDSLV